MASGEVMVEVRVNVWLAVAYLRVLRLVLLPFIGPDRLIRWASRAPNLMFFKVGSGPWERFRGDSYDWKQMVEASGPEEPS